MTAIGCRRQRSRAFAVCREALARAFFGNMRCYLVNGFPKCGGTWLDLVLAGMFGVPFRRDQPNWLEHSVTRGHFVRSHACAMSSHSGMTRAI